MTLNENGNGTRDSFAQMIFADYIEVLGRKVPVPGGGGASAFAAAAGTALGRMVGSLTVGKKRYADVEQQMLEKMEMCRRLEKEFLRLSDEDARVFEPLSRAYRLPSSTEEEVRRKKEVMELALARACSVPLRIMENCAKAVELVRFFAENGSKLARSDAGTAAAFLRAAMEGASLNVWINTRLMENREEADRLNAKAGELLKVYVPAAQAIFDNVAAQLTE